MNIELKRRVELRTMELQATEEENAAFLYFVKLIRRMLSEDKLGLNFYIPITLVQYITNWK